MNNTYNEYQRFQMDLEFVQLLASPFYLHQLAIREYFSDAQFINYLNYLQYFRKQEYMKYIRYPLSLKMLECLQQQSFREKLTDYNYIIQLDHQLEETFKIMQNL